MNKKILTVFALSLTMVLFSSCRLKKELSLTYVPEEQGITFEKITDELADNIIRPSVSTNSFGDVNDWSFLNTYDLSLMCTFTLAMRYFFTFSTVNSHGPQVIFSFSCRRPIRPRSRIKCPIPPIAFFIFSIVNRNR